MNSIAIYWDFPTQVRTLQDASGSDLLLLHIFLTHGSNAVHAVATPAHAHHNDQVVCNRWPAAHFDPSVPPYGGDT